MERATSRSGSRSRRLSADANRLLDRFDHLRRLDVDDATRFTEVFTHLRTGQPCRDRIGLLNVLLAEGINLGLRKGDRGHEHARVWELMELTEGA